MINPLRELRTRAEILHRRVQALAPLALVRLRALRQLRDAPDELLIAVAKTIRRSQCLTLVACEAGFDGWPHAKHVLSGDSPIANYGGLLYPRHCASHLNLWYRSYEEALLGHRTAGGYLLAFRNQFFVAHAPFVEDLGLSPWAPEWRAMEFDWVRPRDPTARTRLYGELIGRLPKVALS